MKLRFEKGPEGPQMLLLWESEGEKFQLLNFSKVSKSAGVEAASLGNWGSAGIGFRIVPYQGTPCASSPGMINSNLGQHMELGDAD